MSIRWLSAVTLGLVLGLALGIWVGWSLNEGSHSGLQPGLSSELGESGGPAASEPVSVSNTQATLSPAGNPSTTAAGFNPPPSVSSGESVATLPGAAGPPKIEARLVSVTDGDTIVVTYGEESGGVVKERVRLIGMDAPEVGEPFSLEASRKLAEILGQGPVFLETDVETRDRYGRLLAYVWVGTAAAAPWEEGATQTTGSEVLVMANLEMVRAGLATLYTVPPNVAHVEELRRAQQEAQAAGRGMWGASASSPLRIVAIRYNAPGDDNFNLNEEYVVFEVLVSGSLKGYAVEDETGHRYEFPDRIFAQGSRITLHTGTGRDAGTDLYWGQTGSAVWNNSGDTVKVLDPQGRVVASQSY
jgi:endonuclease YncB( thermonuclease family)